MIVILGCGELAESISRILSGKGEKPLWLVPKGAVRPKGTGARILTAPADKLVALVPDEAGAAFVLAGDDTLGERISRRLRRSRPDILILTEASSPEAAARLRKAGIDFALETGGFLASTMVEEITELEARRAARRLVAAVSSCRERGLAVFLHDNPDPDTIASALAIKRICKENRVPCTLYHGGEVGRPGNLALVSLTGTKLVRLASPEEAAAVMKKHAKTALIESTRPGQNNILPAGAKVDIIIDHHPLPASLVPEAEFVDLRPSAGAAATILTGYLRNLQIRPDPVLASALLYGILVDTASFTRNVGPQDLEAAMYLSEHAEMELICRFESPPMPEATADVIGKAIRDRKRAGGHVIAFVGAVRDREDLPQAAEFLLRLEGSKAAVVIGIVGDDVCISARSSDPSIDLGRILRKAFGASGSAGGHAAMAGARVPVAELAGGKGAARHERAAGEALRRYIRTAGIGEG